MKSFLGALKSIVAKDQNLYIAQGLEIDYCAQGKDQKTAIENFVWGISASIETNMRYNGTLKTLFRAAPESLWQFLLFEQNGDFRKFEIQEEISNNIYPFSSIHFYIIKKDITEEFSQYYKEN